MPVSAAADAELDRFFEACPTSFAQQTTGWRNVITGAGSDEPVFLGCRRHGRLVGVLPAYRFAGPLGAILTNVQAARRRRCEASDGRHRGVFPCGPVWKKLLIG